MASIAPGVMTSLFEQARAGDQAAVEKIARIVYRPLRRQARKLVAEGTADTIHPTSLVQEVLAELFRDGVFVDSPDRKYFFKAASNAMRQLAVDHARKTRALKRGRGYKRVRLDKVIDHIAALEVDILELDEVLKDLESHDPRMADVVQMKFFIGLTNPEVAKQLDVSLSTVQSDWRIAKDWLFERLSWD